MKQLFKKIFDLDPNEVEAFVKNLMVEQVKRNGGDDEYLKDYDIVIRWIVTDNSFYVFLEPKLKTEDYKHFYFKDKKEKVLALRGGDKLQYRNGYLLSSNGDYIASLSKEQREKIKEYEDNNYCVKEAEVSYVIAWQPKEEEQEVAVCLANLVLEKNKS